MKKTRNVNFEIMRILSMLFIIIWHILLWGKVTENCKNPAISLILNFINCIIMVHVNSFILLSGYFQSKSKIKISKIFKLLLQVVFYIFIMLIIAIKVGWITDYNIVTFMDNVLPSSVNKYWFIRCYLLMYILSDYLNFFISKMDQKKYKGFIMVSFLIMSILPFISGFKILSDPSYTFYFFIFLYFLGGYLRRYSIKDSYHFKNMSIKGYRLLMIIIFISCAIINHIMLYYSNNVAELSNLFSNIASRLRINYASSFTIIQTIAYFEIFKSFDFSIKDKLNKLIIKVSSSVFGIYLIHENPFIRQHLYILLGIDNGEFYGYTKILYVFVFAVIIFIGACIIELLRQLLFYLLSKIPIIKKIILCLKKYILSFNFNLNW